MRKMKADSLADLVTMAARFCLARVPKQLTLIGQRLTTDYATVLLPLPGISNDLEVVCLL